MGHVDIVEVEVSCIGDDGVWMVYALPIGIGCIVRPVSLSLP